MGNILITPYHIGDPLCCSSDHSLCSIKFSGLSSLLLIWKFRTMIYGLQVSICWRVIIISFSYVDLTILMLDKYSLVNVKGHAYCIRTTLTLLLKESHSRTQFLVKFITNITRLVHIDSSKVEKASQLLHSLKRNSLLQRMIREFIFFHNSLQTSYCSE